MNIITKISKKTNYQTASRNKNNIKYIVIHYVGGVSSAAANATYFANNTVKVSSHYFVDEKSVYRCVDEKDIAWHCGASLYKHPNCRNSNSIGIEMCCKKDSLGRWYFEQQTVDKTIELTKSLMAKYGIPVGNVVRHYDVTGKTCPEPFVRDKKAWDDFKSKLTATTTTAVAEKPVNKVLLSLPIIKNGVEGETVKFLQNVLKSYGYKGADGKALTADGDCGKNTVFAIKKWQAANNLTADGIFGQNSWKKLLGI